MRNKLTEMTGAEFPLFAFTHCRDVVAAVTNAGGFGVLGGSGFTPETLEQELKWIDDHVDGKPYGIDILFPENIPASAQGVTSAQLAAQIDPKYLDFTASILKKHGIDATPEQMVNLNAGQNVTPERGNELMDVAFAHPIRCIVNALGIAPKNMIDRAKQNGVPVGALVGAKEHALRQVNAGVDFLVAQGTEAGGHCGEVSTLVLVPEVIRAIRGMRDVPVLAAGGIMTGEQMAAAMAMGAQGVWTGSVWLATHEAETSEAFRDKMVAASSRDTVRRTQRTGKPSRQLRSAWHDAWDSTDSPGTLPMPHMGMVSSAAFNKIDAAAGAGNAQALDLVSYFVGQGVGLVDARLSATQVVQNFKEEFAEAFGTLVDTVEAE
ncbi:MAG: nitronate monooxygenase [Paracoccaceae bacterium]